MGLEASEIGFKNKKNWIKLDPRFRDEGLFMVDILHEMGHIAGLRHEFARGDAYKHVNDKREEDSTDVIKIGKFDYDSIM